LGAQAPPPGRPGEGLREYKGRLLSALLPYTSSYRNSDAFALAGTPIEAEIKKEIAANIADRRIGNPDGTLRPVTTTEGGITTTIWHGDDTRQWMSKFMRPYQCADIKVYDKAGNQTLHPVRWGTPPPPRR
jgi:hypothetical protein